MKLRKGQKVVLKKTGPRKLDSNSGKKMSSAGKNDIFSVRREANPKQLYDVSSTVRHSLSNENPSVYHIKTPF